MRLGWWQRTAIGLIKHSFAILNVRKSFLITHDKTDINSAIKTTKYFFNCYWIFIQLPQKFFSFREALWTFHFPHKFPETPLTSFSSLISGNQKAIASCSSHVTHYQTLNQIYQISRWFVSRFCASSLSARIMFHVAFSYTQFKT